jgi:hypothetical protein
VRSALALAAIAALVACPVAAGHGGAADRDYRSTVTAVTPRVAELQVQVLDGDDRLRLRNDSGEDVTIRSYDGEPYLRFPASGGVFRNANSPATY